MPSPLPPHHPQGNPHTQGPQRRGAGLEGQHTIQLAPVGVYGVCHNSHHRRQKHQARGDAPAPPPPAAQKPEPSAQGGGQNQNAQQVQQVLSHRAIPLSVPVLSLMIPQTRRPFNPHSCTGCVPPRMLSYPHVHETPPTNTLPMEHSLPDPPLSLFQAKSLFKISTCMDWRVDFLPCKAKIRRHPDGWQGFLTQSGRKIRRQDMRGEILNRL